MEVDLILDRKAGDNIRDNILKGTVQSIAPTAVETISPLGLAEQRVKVLVLIEPTADSFAKEQIENLFPGYKLDVEFTLDKRENELVVPKTALFPYGEKEALWVVRNGKAEVQPVEKGFENEKEAAITKGLQQGDMVILNPRLEGLKEGKKIVAR